MGYPPAFLFLAPDLAPPLAAGFLAAALPAPLAFREVPAVADPPALRAVVPPALLPDFLDGFAGDLLMSQRSHVFGFRCIFSQGWKGQVSNPTLKIVRGSSLGTAEAGWSALVVLPLGNFLLRLL